MARDWSRQANRDRERVARRADAEIARILAEDEPRPSKVELRAQADAAIAGYRGPIKRLPMFAALRCRSCGHRGAARVPPGATPSFRCSACGSSLVAWRV